MDEEGCSRMWDGGRMEDVGWCTYDKVGWLNNLALGWMNNPVQDVVGCMLGYDSGRMGRMDEIRSLR